MTGRVCGVSAVVCSRCVLVDSSVLGSPVESPPRSNPQLSSGFHWGPLTSSQPTCAPFGPGKDPGLQMSFHFPMLNCAVKKHSGPLRGRRHALFLRPGDLFYPFSIPVSSESFIGKRVIFHSEW